MLVTHRYSTALILLGLWCLGCDGDGDRLTEPPADPTFLVAPKAPSNTKAVALAYNLVRVSWTDNSLNENGFQVYRSTTGATGTYSLRATRLPGVTKFRDARVAPLKSYCYKVRAFRTRDGTRSYSAFSNAACATTPAAPIPAAPSGMVAKPASSTAVSATWADKSSNEDGFLIQRSLDAGSTWTTAGTAGPNVTTFQDNDGLASEPSRPCYRVLAYNEHGNSGASNVSCTTLPVGPTNLTASSAEAGINLTWADNSDVEDGYEVQRTTDGVTFRTLVTSGANTTSYHDDGANNSTLTYWYRVRARKDAGFSDFSNVPNARGGCTATSSTEQVCDDYQDNDCDGAIDLGDSECPPFECGFDFCPPGYVCGWDGYCVAHCNDGQWNGGEGDVDCGANCSSGCQAGQHCWVNADCASNACVYDVCQ
jgi:hypothetical protein